MFQRLKAPKNRKWLVLLGVLVVSAALLISSKVKDHYQQNIAINGEFVRISETGNLDNDDTIIIDGTKLTRKQNGKTETVPLDKKDGRVKLDGKTYAYIYNSGKFGLTNVKDIHENIDYVQKGTKIYEMQLK